jgi:hypothetical protein
MASQVAQSQLEPVAAGAQTGHLNVIQHNRVFGSARDVLLGASPALVLMVVLGLSKIFAAVG